jgi:photosystem II stability/assembly factor-like uncharacterized protein
MARRTGIAVAAAVLIGIVAFLQPLRRQPLRSPTLVERLFYPIEWNPFARVPQMRGELRDVAAVPGTDELWLAASGRLLVHSDDDGRSWTAQSIDAAEPAEPLLPQSSWTVPFVPAPAWAGKPPSLEGSPDVPSVEQRPDPPRAEEAPRPEPPGEETKTLEEPHENAPGPDDSPREEVRDPGPPELRAIAFADVQTGFVAATGPVLYVTEDRGRSWQLLPLDGYAKGSAPGVLEPNAIQFADAQHGWITGEGDSALRTVDGGRRWEWVRLPSSRSWLAAFSGTTHGVIVATPRPGEEETAFVTEDGGRSWSPVASPAADVAGVWASAESVNALTGDADELEWFTLAAGEGKWERAGSYGSPMEWFDALHRSGVRNVHFRFDTDEILLWKSGADSWFMHGETGLIGSTDGRVFRTEILGSGGHPALLGHLDDGDGYVRVAETVLETTDHGATWRPRLELTEGSFPSDREPAAIVAGPRALVESEAGLISMSLSGGERPKVEIEGRRFAFVESLGGPAALAIERYSSAGHRTSDGTHWESFPTDSRVGDPSCVDFVDELRGWVADGGRILRTEDGARTWSVLDPESGPMIGIDFHSDGRGWAVGENGAVAFSPDRGDSWALQPSGTVERLNGVSFLDFRRGFVVGNSGTVLTTEDGGATWRRIPTPTDSDLLDVHFTDDQYGWIAGAGTTLLRTENGGATWSLVSASHWPAPWFYAALLATLAFALRRPAEAVEPEHRESIADLLAPDRPIRWTDPDPLGFKEIALGVSRFLRNAQTEPPLTLAVTGEWGSGKSSLMTLLHEDLERLGFRPIWFNAWHHQKGEHLLASLFANIRSQGLPPLGTWAGFRFRSQLLWRRIWARWFVLLLALPIAAGGLAFLVHQWGHWAEMAALLPPTPEGSDSGAVIEGYLVPLLKSLGTTGSALLVVLVPLWRGVRAFGLDPAKLRNAMATDLERGGVKVEPGARFRFAQEFRDVSTALRPRTMVIFIDDLDRCSKEHVVEILEVVNFLVSSGPCFVVLGMARDWVETCVGLAFRELANSGDANAHDGEVERREFARLYLQKLINIEIPVPKLEPDESRKLLAPEAVHAPRVRLRAPLGDRMLGALKIGAVGGLTALGLWLGLQVQPPHVVAAPAAAPQERGHLVISDIAFGGERLDLTLPVQSVAVDPARALPVGGSLVIGQIPLGGSSGDLVLHHTKAEQIAAKDESSLVLGPFPLADGKASLSLRLPVGTTPSVGAGPPSERVVSYPELRPAMAGAPRFYGPRFDELWTRLRWVVPAITALAFLVALIRAATTRRAVVVHDSKRFVGALDIWFPWIALNPQTPRTLKRFMNRTRYVAMRLRSADDDDRPERRAWWRRPKPFAAPSPPQTPSSDLTEPALVALAAIHYAKPQWIRGDRAFQQLCQGDVIGLVASAGDTAGPVPVDSLVAAIDRHAQEYPTDWPIAESQRLRFLDILADVRVG